MHVATQQLLQIALQGSLLEQPARFHLKENINIAFRSCLSASDRAEDPHFPRAVERRNASDLLSTPAQLIESRRRACRARVRVRGTATLDLSAEISELAQPRLGVFRMAAHAVQSRVR